MYASQASCPFLVDFGYTDLGEDEGRDADGEEPTRAAKCEKGILGFGISYP